MLIVELKVSAPSTDNGVVFVFSDSGVSVQVGDGPDMQMTWNDWEFIAKVYGKRRTS
jgi:hypothetical protein